MRRPSRWSAWVLFVLTVPAVSGWAQEEAAESRWRVEGAYAWAWMFGNDYVFGDRRQTTIETGTRSFFDADFEQHAEPLIARSGSAGQPFTRVQYERGGWAFAFELTAIETEGALGGDLADGETVTLSGFETPDGFQLRYDVANELSMWAVRVDAYREVSSALWLRFGFHGAQLDHSTAQEEAGGVGPASFIGDASFERVTASRMDASLLGPAVGLWYQPRLGDRWLLDASFVQSFLIASTQQDWTLLNEATIDDPFFGSFLTHERFFHESSTRSLVPATEVRVSALFELSEHVSLGGIAFVSVWIDAPRALVFSRTSGTEWSEPKETLSYISVGPVVRVTF